MSVTISLELSRRDLQYFRRAVRQARHAIRDADEADIIEAIAAAVAGYRQTSPLPDFIARYLPELDALLAMLEDPEWRLPRAERERLLATLIYLADPEDLIPDNTPGVGFLDDAIMIELLLRELAHVREAYRDFCRYRESYPAGQAPRRTAPAAACAHAAAAGERPGKTGPPSLVGTQASVAQQRRAPGKAAPERFHQEKLAAPDAAVAHGRVEGERNRGGGGGAPGFEREILRIEERVCRPWCSH